MKKNLSYSCTSQSIPGQLTARRKMCKKLEDGDAPDPKRNNGKNHKQRKTLKILKEKDCIYGNKPSKDIKQ